MSAEFLGRETHSRSAKIRLYLILQHEISALASFWRGSGIRLGDEIAPRYLWQRNNNVRQSTFATDQDRLTLPGN
jgi:hypothetical protein